MPQKDSKGTRRPTRPHYYKTPSASLIGRCFKPIDDKLKRRIEGEVKALLHADRDTMRNLRKHNPRKVSFCANSSYYCEAFGIMRGLHMLGYGYFGSSNLDGMELDEHGEQPEHNLKWWFGQLEREVLEAEGFYDGSHKCAYCYRKYHQDSARLKGRIFHRARVSQPIENVHRKRLSAVGKKPTDEVEPSSIVSAKQRYP